MLVPKLLEIAIGTVKEQKKRAVAVAVSDLKSGEERDNVLLKVSYLLRFPVLLGTVSGVDGRQDLHVELDAVFEGVIILLSFELFYGVNLISGPQLVLRSEHDFSKDRKLEEEEKKRKKRPRKNSLCGVQIALHFPRFAPV